MNKTTVGIVNWNSGPLLQVCIESLLAEPNVDICVVDNNSTDGSADFLDAFPGKVQCIKKNTNAGFAAGCNTVLQATTTAYVLLLNPDVQVLPGSIQMMEEFMDSHASVAALGGYVGDKYLPRKLPTPYSLIRENLGFPVGAVYDRASFVDSRKNSTP